MSLRVAIIAGAIAIACAGTARAQPRPKPSCDLAFSGMQTAHKAGRFLEAREQGNKCIEACPAFARAECVRWLREVDDAQPSIVVRVEGATTASVSADGRVVAADLDGRAIDLDPGKHTVVVALASGEKRSSTFVLSEGEKRRPVAVTFTQAEAVPAASPPPKDVVRPPPEPREPPPVASNGGGRGLHPLFWTGGVMTVVGAGVGAVFGGIAMGQASDVKSNCPFGRCPPAYHDTLDSLRVTSTVSTVGFVVAGIGLVLTVTGLLMPAGTRVPVASAPGVWTF